MIEFWGVKTPDQSEASLPAWCLMTTETGASILVCTSINLIV